MLLFPQRKHHCIKVAAGRGGSVYINCKGARSVKGETKCLYSFHHSVVLFFYLPGATVSIFPLRVPCCSCKLGKLGRPRKRKRGRGQLHINIRQIYASVGERRSEHSKICWNGGHEDGLLAIRRGMLQSSRLLSVPRWHTTVEVKHEKDIGIMYSCG